MDFWSLSLVVEFDEERGLLMPSVRLGGGSPFTSGSVRATMVDPDECTYITVGRPLRPQEIGTQIRLPSFPSPQGVPVPEALRWGWDVAVTTDRLERIRWRRYLEVGISLGVDCEIRLAGPYQDLRSKAEEEGWGPEAPWDLRDSDRLLADLVADGILNEADRKAVLALAHSKGSTVERTLIETGNLSERDVLERYAEVTGTELLDLEGYPIDPEVAGRIPEEVARRYGLLGVGRRCELVAVATSDPHNVDAMLAVQDSVGQPYVVLATRPDILSALDRLARD